MISQFSNIAARRCVKSSWLSSVIVMLVASMAWQTSAKADLISYFNFNGSYAASGGSKQATSTAATSVPAGSYNLSNAGTTLNAQNGSVAGNSLTITGGSTNNSKVFQFSSGTAGYSNIVVSFAATTSSATSFNSISVRGSNGTTVYAGSITPSTTGFSTYSLNFGSIPSLNDNSAAYFQLQFLGATDTVGTISVDNFAVSGTLLTPEPSTWAMMALGLCVIGLIGWKRNLLASINSQKY